MGNGPGAPGCQLRCALGLQASEVLVSQTLSLGRVSTPPMRKRGRLALSFQHYRIVSEGKYQQWERGEEGKLFS